MAQRFFAENPIVGRTLSLGGDEGRHLARVMRAKVGDLVVAFDGCGAEFLARVANVARSAVELEIVERRDVNRELPIAVTLGVAFPKGDRQRFLVEKAVELGVACLTPLETRRGVAQPTAAALARWQRTVIEASKQCGRNRLMQLAPPLPAVEYFQAAPPSAPRLAAHPGGVPMRTAIEAANLLPSDVAQAGCASGAGAPENDSRSRNDGPPERAEIFFAVGPEGGFTEEEIAVAAAAGWRLVDLGPRLLRVETAALALAAWAAMEAT